jgi:hypothetical protein
MPLFYTNETKRYINIRYAHVSNNWDLSNGKETYGTKYKYYEAVNCTEFNFMDNSTDEIGS